MPMRLAWGDLDSEEAPFPEAQGCSEWHCPWWWGWAEETWKPFLEALCPPLSVLCGSFHLQPGFLMAMLGYNEERYGLDRCNMIAFYPRNSAVKEEGVRPKRKAIEQGHMADHVLASVSAVYADFRLAASKAVRKRHLFRDTQGGGAARKACEKLQPEPCRHHCSRVLSWWCGGHGRRQPWCRHSCNWELT